MVVLKYVCTGGTSDIRVIRQLLPKCEIRPLGGRTFVEKIIADRVINTPENVLNKFEELLPSFSPGGFRFENYLTFFAGKDLLWMMQSKLTEFEFEPTAPGVQSPIPVFLERIVSRIERSEEVWTWLSEWKILRELIINTNF